MQPIKISCKEFYEQEMQDIKQIVDNSGKRYELHVIQVGDDLASNSYTKSIEKDCNKVGIEFVLHKYDRAISCDFLIDELWQLNDRLILGDITKGDTKCGIIIQQPLPEGLEKINEGYLIDFSYDIDGAHYLEGYSEYAPCTPLGIIDWLEANEINLEGKNVTIIGRSKVVGLPLAKMMMDKNATVTVCHSKTGDLINHFEHADIIVSAVGKPRFISHIPYSINKNPIAIDVGISIDENGKICGDFDMRWDDVCDNLSYYVPPTGNGVSLLTRAALMRNMVTEIW